MTFPCEDRKGGHTVENSKENHKAQSFGEKKVKKKKKN